MADEHLDYDYLYKREHAAAASPLYAVPASSTRAFERGRHAAAAAAGALLYCVSVTAALFHRSAATR